MGLSTYIKKINLDKLGFRTNICLFIGYPKMTIGYYIYNPHEQKVFVSNNAKFLDEDYITSESRINVVLEEQGDESMTEPSENNER